MNLSKRSRSLLSPALLAAAALASFVAGQAVASGVPEARPLRYSGTLMSPDEMPLEGARNIAIILSDTAEEDATPLCQLPSTEVLLERGHFSLELPDACAEAVASQPDVWVEVSVDGEAFGKAKVSAVPYALEARHAVRADVASSLPGDGPVALGRRSFSVVLADGQLPENPTFRFIGDPTVTRAIDGVCPQGTYVVSGGGDAGERTGNFLRESRPVSEGSWRIACSSPTGDVLCTSYNLVCSRVGP